MSTLRHSYGDSVIFASLKTSVPETKISVIWRSPRYTKLRIFLVINSENLREYLCAISPFCFSARRTAVCGWRQRMAIPVSYALIPDLVFKPWRRQLESWMFLGPMFHQRRIQIQIQKKPNRYLTMAGRVGVTRYDVIQQHRIKATIFQGHKTLFVVGTGCYAHGCPAKFPL